LCLELLIILFGQKWAQERIGFVQEINQLKESLKGIAPDRGSVSSSYVDQLRKVFTASKLCLPALMEGFNAW
jgi:hypothetical protein